MSSTAMILACRNNSIVRRGRRQARVYGYGIGQVGHGQVRSYVYLPLSWPEFQERFQNWMETFSTTSDNNNKHQRIVHVQLLSRKQQNQQDLVRDRNPNHSVQRKRLLSKVVVMGRNKQHQYQNQNQNQNQNQIQIQIQNQNQNQNHPSQQNSMTTMSALPLPLPLALPLPLPLPTTKYNINININNSDLEARYQGWKTRRREQYQGWKRQRQEQYQGWKLRRQEQYQRVRQRALVKTKAILLKEYSKPEWFDALGRPLTSKDNLGHRFVNPWQSQSTNGIHSVETIVRWRMQRMTRTLAQFGWLKSMVPKLSWNSPAPELPHPSPPLPTLRTTTTTTTTPSTSTSTSTTSENINNNNNSNHTNTDNQLTLTWLGHSTCWVQMNGMTILTDPMFSLRASPFQWLPIGVPRELPPSHSMDELLQHVHDNNNNNSNKIDICCITHDHYDHMDKDSILALKQHVQLWVVPLGIADWLVQDCDIDRDAIVELEWWQQLHIAKNQQQQQNHVHDHDHDHHDNNKISPSQSQSPSPSPSPSPTVVVVEDMENEKEKDLTITCCPASHWASRTMTDRNTRLWCSFALQSHHHHHHDNDNAVESTQDSNNNTTTTATTTSRRRRRTTTTKSQNLFFCGDTGYPTFPLFRQIGDALGPFDLAAIPIGAYKPSEMMKDAHVNPKEAVQIHKDLRSKHSVGIHWGSFPLSEEALHDPPKDLKRALQEEEEEEAGIGDGMVPPFETLGHGATIKVTGTVIDNLEIDADIDVDVDVDDGNYLYDDEDKERHVHEDAVSSYPRACS